MMKRYLILIALLALVIASPALAYTTLYEGTTGISSATTSSTLSSTSFILTVKDIVSFAGNVTRIEMTGLTGYKADNLTKSYGPYPIQKSGVTYGNASVEWDWAPGGSYSGQGNIYITIHDMSAGALTGEHGLTIGGIPCRNWRPYQDDIGAGGYGQANISVTPYAFKTGFAEQPNGTIKIYGGSAVTPSPPTGAYACNLGGWTVAPNPYDLQCWPDEVISPAASNWSWTITQPDNSTYSSTNETLVKTLNQDGWHGLTYRVCNSYGCGYSNTSQLVNITSDYIPATGIAFWAHAYDPLKTAKIAGATVGIRNLTSGTWRNLSTSDGSARFTSTDYYLTEKLTAGQTVGLMASASGYITANTTVTIPYDGWEYLINLVATGDVPTGANATLYVNVIDAHSMKGLSGATVTISNTSIPYSSSKLSNTGGIATFPNIASGTYSIVATKTGYTSSTVSWPAGASAVTNAYLSLLPTGATPVVTGTGGNPLFDGDGNPIVGYDLEGNPITAGPTPDTRTAEEKDDEMMDMLRDQGPMLIQFFIVCFVVYMVMGMAGKGGR
jgi:hypothetical protein